MRARELFREAGRDLASGTSRTVLLAASAMVVFFVGVTGSLYLNTQAISLHERYADSGASTTIVRALGVIDGRRCAALNGISGIRGAMALRQADDVALAVLPSFARPSFEVTGDPIGVLGGELAASPGIFVARGLADQVGLMPGERVVLSTGATSTRGVFAYPDDGRVQVLASAILIPVPPDQEPYDQCWITAWPVGDEVAGLSSSVLADGVDAARTAEVVRLNSSLGTPKSVIELVSSSGALPLRIGAALAGVVAGLVWMRSRRVELALALQLGQRRGAQVTQMLVEVLAVSLAAGALVSVASIVCATVGMTALDSALLIADAASGATGVLCGIALGVVIAEWTVRESHLSAWSRDR